MSKARQPFLLQARSLFRTKGAGVDRTERVANALGHLLGVLHKLASLEDSGVKVRARLPLTCSTYFQTDTFMHAR